MREELSLRFPTCPVLLFGQTRVGTRDPYTTLPLTQGPLEKKKSALTPNICKRAGYPSYAHCRTPSIVYFRHIRNNWQIQVLGFQHLDYIAAAVQSAGEPSTGLAFLDRYSIIVLGDLLRVGA